MARVVWISPTSGISGDMCLAALVDLGASPGELIKTLRTLNLPDEFHLEFSDVTRASLRAKYARVDITESNTHRSLSEINAYIDGSQMSPMQKKSAKAIFHALADVEAKIHSTTPDKVQLHEVGSLDAIIDICGFVVAKDLLGIEAIYFSSPALGSGVSKGIHGKLPVPTPAVLELLRDIPAHAGPGTFELTTPTGAAILSVLGMYVEGMPEMVIRSIGYGAGTKDPIQFPNVIKFVMGDTVDCQVEYSTLPGRLEEIVELSTNLDDISGELIGYFIGAIMEAGGLDVFVTPLLTKKDRTGILLVVLTSPETAVTITQKMFQLTGTLGIRSQRKTRYVLDRSFFEITVLGEKVSVKVGPFRAKPEFSDLIRVAELHQVSPLSVERMAQSEIQKYFETHSDRLDLGSKYQ